ncbi:MAG: hypothetical protein J6X66_05175 [Lachnospiraceae bacterium]|nr:hypothetical protein [Lachnospiraceae bacterium]
MKRKKRTQRLLAMLLTLLLCVGEFASTGFSVLAADDEIADTVSDTDAVSEDESTVLVEPEDEAGKETVSEDAIDEQDTDSSEEISIDGHSPGGQTIDLSTFEYSGRF